MTGAHQAPSCKELTVATDHMSEPELSGQLEDLRQQYEALRGLDLSLDLTRGKPNKEQLALSDANQESKGTDWSLKTAPQVGSARSPRGKTGRLKDRACASARVDAPTRLYCGDGEPNMHIYLHTLYILQYRF